VHALRHVHELLVPGGTLVDIHPVTEEEVEAAGEQVGVILEPTWVSVELPNSESAMRQAIAEGLYELEVEKEYDVLQHFDDAEELIQAKSDLLEEQQELVAAIRASSPPLVTRMRVVFRRLRALRRAA
jgi:tRNA(Ile)-lysidine synthase TilS/MesJ